MKRHQGRARTAAAGGGRLGNWDLLEKTVSVGFSRCRKEEVEASAQLWSIPESQNPSMAGVGRDLCVPLHVLLGVRGPALSAALEGCRGPIPALLPLPAPVPIQAGMPLATSPTRARCWLPPSAPGPSPPGSSPAPVPQAWSAAWGWCDPRAGPGAFPC